MCHTTQWQHLNFLFFPLNVSVICGHSMSINIIIRSFCFMVNSIISWNFHRTTRSASVDVDVRCVCVRMYVVACVSVCASKHSVVIFGPFIWTSSHQFRTPLLWATAVLYAIPWDSPAFSSWCSFVRSLVRLEQKRTQFYRENERNWKKKNYSVTLYKNRTAIEA